MSFHMHDLVFYRLQLFHDIGLNGPALPKTHCTTPATTVECSLQDSVGNLTFANTWYCFAKDSAAPGEWPLSPLHCAS